MADGFIAADDGVRLYFRQAGVGPKRVVIPNGLYFVDDFRPLQDEYTFIAYDPRHRGRSDSVPGDLHRDVEDLDAVRRYFGMEQMVLIGHSYAGLLVALYAKKYPANVERVVQIGPPGPVAGKQYPANLAYADEALPAALAKMEQLLKERQGEDDEQICRKVWGALAMIYVADPVLADRIDWGRCELPNERNFMAYYRDHLLPSLNSIRLSAEDVSSIRCPVLVVHGTKDRSAPYGAGREWALILPDARLVAIPDTAHAPWVEKPDEVFGTLRSFLAGKWPEGAEKVTALDPVGAASA